MQFWQLISHIKNDGCNIRLYDKEELKAAQCAGTFDITKKGNPLICLTTKGHTQQELLQLLLHEYAHFLQWRAGFLHQLEGENLKLGWVVIDLWLKDKRKYTYKELLWARNAILLIEYDADIRVLELSHKLGVDIGSHDTHMANAYSYVTLIKWAIKNKRWSDYPGDASFSGRVRTPQEILAEITPQEEQIFNDYLGEES